MKRNPVVLAIVLGFLTAAAGAETVDLGTEASGLRRFLIYPHLEKGLEALARGERDRTISEFEQARTLAPNTPAIALHLAGAYRHFGDLNRAESVLREQIAINPGNLALNKVLNELRSSRKATNLKTVVPDAPNTSVTTKPSLSPHRVGHASVRSGDLTKKHAISRSKKTAARPHKVVAALADNQPSPSDIAYQFADEAYQASAKGQHAIAVVAARKSVQLAPGNRDYRSLLVYELLQIDQLDEADAVALQAPTGRVKSGNEDELVAWHKLVRQLIAAKYFEASNQAVAAGTIDVAAGLSRKAIEYAPQTIAYHLQLVGLLLKEKKWIEAEATASQAIRNEGPHPALWVLRAHALQNVNQRLSAAVDLDAALAAPALTESDQQNYRLISIDAALAAGDSKKARTLLAPLMVAPTVDEGVLNRHAAIGRVIPLEWAVPKVVCVGSSLLPACEVWPGENPPDPAYALAAESYREFGSQNYVLAVSKVREALELSPGNRQYRMLLVNALMAGGELEQADQEVTAFLADSGHDADMLVLQSHIHQRLGLASKAALDAEAALSSHSLSEISQIDMLLLLNRKSQARERFDAALLQGAFNGKSDVDLAYLEIRVGNDAAAMDAFERAALRQSLPATAFQDAAYVAARLGRNETSVAYFKQAMDAAEAGQLSMASQKLFNASRSVADQTRQGGVYASVTYRGIAASGLSLTPGATDDTLQGGVEAYWRPLGYRDGRLFELYGGLSETLYSKVGLPAGAPSVQGALGARVKPLADANLILALERRLKMGSQTQDDWLARIGYSWDQGFDLRTDVTDWSSAQVYAETGRFIETKQNYASFEGQVGRSFRLVQSHPTLVVFPHVVLGADRNTGYEAGHENAVGAGIGVGLRYWFNSDKYNAPRSYLDSSLQYRGHLGGDDRAKGVLFRLTLSY